MKLFALSIRDEKLKAFLPVFFVRATGEGMRHFMDACKDKNTPMGKHPEDYTLHCLAQFDDVSGEFENGASQLMTGLQASGAE